MRRRVFASVIRFCALSAAFALAGCAASMHHRAGMSAMDSHDYVKAVNELKQASEAAPHDVGYRQDWLNNRDHATQQLLTMAEASAAAGDNAKAAEYYRTILKYDAENARASAGLESINQSERAAEETARAKEAIKRGEMDEAGKLLSRALERSPNLPEAKALMREVESARDKNLISAPELGNYYKKPINLEFRDASLKLIFESLSRTTGINFIFDRDVKSDQRTTVFLKQTTLADAVDVLLTTNQLEKKILNPSSVLIYPNTAAKLKEYQDLVVKAIYLSNLDVKQAATMLKTVLKLKDVYADEKYHLIVLRESPETISLAEKLVALHDLDDPEVMLDVEVLEVNRTRLLNLGVQFPDQLTVTPSSSSTSGVGGVVGANSQTIKIADLQHLNSGNLNISLPSIALNLQKLDGDANLLANPRLRVRDREKAKIMIGDKVPVVTTTATPNGFLSENIQYIDVGLKLDVEPEIYLHDEIGLKLGLEVSSLVSTVKTNSGSQAYQIGTRNFNSALRLKDGETQVLAGLISDTDRSDASRIPLLGDVPLLGRLFSSQKDDHEKTEIVMAITPHLIRNVQRKGPAAEMFWSGTEATLKDKPLQLRSVDNEGSPAQGAPGISPQSGAGAGAAGGSRGTAPADPRGPAGDSSGIQMKWAPSGPVRVGQAFSLDLQIEATPALRAAPLQIAYNPAQFEVVEVKEGDFFAKGGKSSFSQVVDKASGRISIGVATPGGDGVKGAGSLLKLELKPLVAGSAEVSVLGMTPIGSLQSVMQPAMPVTQKLEVLPAS